MKVVFMMRFKQTSYSYLQLNLKSSLLGNAVVLLDKIQIW